MACKEPSDFEVEWGEEVDLSHVVYVENIKGVDEQQLKKRFDKFGRITRCKVVEDQGFICFTAADEANKAAEEMNDEPLHPDPNQTLRVVSIQPKEEGKNVFVGSLEKEIDDYRFNTEFAKFGCIINAKVMQDMEGYVCFSTPSEASKAIAEMHNRILISRRLLVAHAQLKEYFRVLQLMRMNVYVENFENEVDVVRLKKEFSRFGSIVSATVKRDSYGNSRGAGYVCFSSHEEAKEAVFKMNGYVIISNRLIVRFLQQKKDRESQIALVKAQVAMHHIQQQLARQPKSLKPSDVSIQRAVSMSGIKKIL